MKYDDYTEDISFDFLDDVERILDGFNNGMKTITISLLYPITNTQAIFMLELGIAQEMVKGSRGFCMDYLTYDYILTRENL